MALSLDGTTGISTDGGTTLINNATAAGTLTVEDNLIVNGLTVGRGAGAVSTNTAVGVSALAANTSGVYNASFGYQAGKTNTTGLFNCSFGANSLLNNSGTTANNAFGVSALQANTTGNYNCAFGKDALVSNTTASGNTAVGYQAGYSNTTASGNISFGFQALYSNITAAANTAVGYQAGYYTTVEQNTFVGYAAGFTNSTGKNHVMIGFQAGHLNTTGSNNVFVGNYAGRSVTTGSSNTFIGGGVVNVSDGAGNVVTTGSKNTIIGGYTGNQGGLDIRTANNYIVLSDGDGNPRAWMGAGNSNDLFRVGTTSTNTDAWMHQISYSQTSRGIIGFTNDTSAGNPNGIIIKYTASDSNTGSDNFLNCSSNTAFRAAIRNNGGLANYQANNANLSDRREKTNFAPAGEYLTKICAIPVQTFNYIDQDLENDAGLTLGVVAQDVQEIAPELITESDWGTSDNPKMRLSIYQTDLQYALMKCIQEQQAIIETLTTRITALEGN